MRVLQRRNLPGPILAIVLSPAGNRVAVVSGSGEEDAGASPASTDTPQALHLFRIAAGLLAAEGTYPLAGVPDGEPRTARTPPGRSLGIVFRDESSVVVARVVSRDFEENVEVLDVNLDTGRQHGRSLDLPYPYHVSGLLPALPGRLLLGTANTVAYLDARTLTEVGRARKIDDSGDPEEDDAVPEEAIAAGGFAFDSERRLLYVLTGCFEMGVLTCYRLHAGDREFTRQRRRDIFPTRPEMGIDLPAAGGICLRPDGRSVAAVFKLDDLRLDYQGRPVTDLERAREEALAREAREETPLPPQARIGWLCEIGEGSDTWVEVLSDTERDLDGGARTETNPAGEEVVVGYQACSTDPWDPAPVCVDDRRVALVSPTGLVQLLDVTTGEATLEYDAGGPVTSLCLWPEGHCLLLGGADGSLSVVSLDASDPFAKWHGARAVVPV